MYRILLTSILGLACAPGTTSAIDPVVVNLRDPASTHRLGAVPEEGLLLQLQVVWQRPGSLLDTVGVARAQAGNLELYVLEDGALELSLYGPGAPGADENGWVRLRSQASLERGRPHRVTLAIGPSAILIVDGKEQGRLEGPGLWPDQVLHLGDYPGDAGFAGRTSVERGMVGRVLVERVGPGDADFSLTTLERRAIALERENPGETERIARRQVEFSPRQAAGFHARARARVRVGDLRGARADLDTAIDLAPELLLTWKLRAWVRHEQGDVVGGIADLQHFLEFREDAEAREWLEAWRREAGGTDLVGTPPTGPVSPPSAGAVFASNPLVSLDLTPSDSPRTLTIDERIRMTIPPSILAEGGRLTVASASPVRSDVCGQFESFGVYEVTLDDRHEFSEDIVLECRYDAARLEPGIEAENQILAARWDPDRLLWVELPSVVDAERGVIVMRTRHLSILGWIYKTGVLIYEPVRFMTRTVICVQKFRLYFDPGELNANKWIAGWRGEPSYPAEYQHLWVWKHPAWTPFVRDLTYYLERAYAAYEAAHLTPAADLPVKVEIGPGLSGNDPASYEHTARRLYISSDKVTSRKAQLKHRLAHELFHAIQNQDLGGDAAKATAPSARWWIESTAEYAACRVAWNLDSMGGSTGGTTDGIYPYLLERPLTESGAPVCPHGWKDVGDIEYDRGYFLDFLVSRGAGFRSLYKTVTGGYREKGEILAPLETYLVTNGPGTLPALFREFTGWFLLGEDAPRSRSAEPDPLVSAANPGQKALIGTVPDQPPVLSRSFTLPASYTASTWAVGVAPAEPRGPRVLAVRASTLDAWAVVDLYALPDAARAARPSPEASLTDTTSTGRIMLEPDQTLYVTAVNLDSKRPATATVEVEVLSEMPGGTSPDATHVSIHFAFQGTMEKTLKVLVVDEGSDDRSLAPRTVVEPLEIDTRHGGAMVHPAYTDMPVTIRGRNFHGKAKVEGKEWWTEVFGTFGTSSEGFGTIESLTLRHHARSVRERVFDREARESIDGNEHAEDFEITIGNIPARDSDGETWPFALELDLPKPLPILFRVERKEFAAHDGSFNPANSWSCQTGLIQSGEVRVLFRRK